MGKPVYLSHTLVLKTLNNGFYSVTNTFKESTQTCVLFLEDMLLCVKEKH